MTGTAAVINAGGVAILTTAAATLVASVGGVIVGWRASTRADLAHTAAAEVRVMVNGRLDALVARTQQLEQELVRASLPVPPDPAVA